MALFDTERFILEVEGRPALWDLESPQYLNKHLKIKAWEDICEIFFPSFSTMESTERSEKCKTLQKRWRSLRDCFAREVNTQKRKSGSDKPDRKQYVFYNQLSFLRQGIKKRKTTSSLDESTSQVNDNSDPGVDNGLPQLQDEPDVLINEQDTPQLPSASRPVETITVRPPSVTSRKRVNEKVAATELKLLQDIAKRFAKESAADAPTNTKALEEDEDRLFLQSLLKDLKKVNEDNKLELKSEMILLVKKWQRAGAPQKYPLNVPSNYQSHYRTNNGENHHNYQGSETPTTNQGYTQNRSKNSAQPLRTSYYNYQRSETPTTTQGYTQNRSKNYSQPLRTSYYNYQRYETPTTTQGYTQNRSKNSSQPLRTSSNSPSLLDPHSPDYSDVTIMSFSD